MKKSTKIILITLIGIILLIIPVIVLAENGIKIPFIPYTDPYIEEEARKQNLIEEKAMIINQLAELNVESINSEKSSQQLEIPNDTQANEIENKIKEILNKYSKNKFVEIEKKIEQESSTKGLDNEHSMFDSEVELFELIVEIMETKDLSSDEESVLKELLNDNLDRIQAYDDLNQKVLQ